MKGDPVLKDRLEKALAEVGLGYVTVNGSESSPIGWTLVWSASLFDRPDPHLLWRAWRLALAGTEFPSCCERCYLEQFDLAIQHLPRRWADSPISRCVGGDCPHGNEPGDFWREPVAS